MPRFVYAIGPIEGVGPNKTRAREHAEKQAIEALKRLARGGSMFPAPPGSALLAIEIRPGLYDWGYGWIEQENYALRIIVAGFETYDKALWAAVQHICQVTLDRVRTDQNVTPILDWFDSIECWASRILGDASQAVVLRSQLRDRCHWLARYDAWRAQGAGDSLAHQWATEGRFPNQGDQVATRSSVG